MHVLILCEISVQDSKEAASIDIDPHSAQLYITTFCFNDYNQKHLYNIFNIRKWMQIFFFFFWLTVTAMKTNPGTEEWALRGKEVEKELTKQPRMYQKKRPYLFIYLFIRSQSVCMADVTFLLSLVIETAKGS